MLPEITHHELEAALEETTGLVFAEANVFGPPVDAFAIAASLRIDVAHDRAMAGRARFVRLGEERNRTRAGGTILLRPEPRRERRQWAVAHEIGERWAYRVFESLGIDPCEAPRCSREQVANLLACRLLLPRSWFFEDGMGCGWDLLHLKARYETASHELISRRMLDFGPPIIISIYDQGQLTLRRSNVMGRVPGPSQLERECREYAHAQACPHHVCGIMSEVRAWPIHEPAWKREIVRTSAEMLHGDEEHAALDEVSGGL